MDSKNDLTESFDRNVLTENFFDEFPSSSVGFNVNDASYALDLWALGLGGVRLKGTWVAVGVSPEP